MKRYRLLIYHVLPVSLSLSSSLSLAQADKHTHQSPYAITQTKEPPNKERKPMATIPILIWPLLAH